MKAKARRKINQCVCQGCQEHPQGKTAKTHTAINRVLTTMDEKSRRRFAGLMASQASWGGIQLVHEITGLSRTTIGVGCREIGKLDRASGVRKSGGGRKMLEKKMLDFLMP
jgi:hypothetical protein